MQFLHMHPIFLCALKFKSHTYIYTTVIDTSMNFMFNNNYTTYMYIRVCSDQPEVITASIHGDTTWHKNTFTLYLQ